jgi:hypothetical protein
MLLTFFQAFGSPERTQNRCGSVRAKAAPPLKCLACEDQQEAGVWAEHGGHCLQASWERGIASTMSAGRVAGSKE